MTITGADPESVQVPEYDPDDVDDVPDELRDTEDANRLLGAIARYHRRAVEIDALADAQIDRAQAEIERVNRWRDAQLAPVAISREFLERRVAAWMQANVRINPKGSKTAHLPNGVVVYHSSQPKWEYEDELLLKWLAVHEPGLVRHYDPKPPDPDKPKKDELKKQAVVVDGEVQLISVDEATGEVVTKVVEGVRVEQTPVVVDVVPYNAT